MVEDQILVTIKYLEEGKAAIDASLKGLNKQLTGLMSVNASVAASTGQLYPQFAQQAAILNAMGGAAGSAAQQLVSLRQQGSVFSQIFKTDPRSSVQEYLKQYGGRFSAFSNEAKMMREQIGSELEKVQVYTNDAEGSFRNFTDPEKFRIMRNVFAEQVTAMTTKLINWGKNLQWVGRQMITGLTLPIVLLGRELLLSYTTFNKAQTELQKYMFASGTSIEKFGDTVSGVFGKVLLPQFEKISTETGLYRDEVVNLASAWAAAGYTVKTGLVEFTNLAAQLNLLSQGEIDLESSIELVRSVQASWGLETEQTATQIEKLNLVGNITSLTMGEIADAIPVVSSSASNLGITASELAAALAGMREQGVTASQAANTLKFSLNRLAVPTQAAVDQWENITRTMANAPTIDELLWTKEGVGRGIEGLKDIGEIIGQLSPKEQQRTAGILFGGYRADRMLKLIKSINNANSQFSKGLRAVEDDERALATWTEQLGIVQQSAAQKLKVMKVEIVTLAQKFGELIFPYVEKFGNMLINLMEAFENAPDSIKHFVVALGAILAAIGPATYIVAQLTEAVGMLGKVFAATPLRAIFSIKSKEDPFGMMQLAKANPGDAIIQTLAGVPLANQNIAGSAELAATRLWDEAAALREIEAIDAGTAAFWQKSALSQGAVPTSVANLITGVSAPAKTLLEDRNFTQTLLTQTEDDIKSFVSNVNAQRVDWKSILATQGLTADLESAVPFRVAGGTPFIGPLPEGVSNIPIGGRAVGYDLIAGSLGLSSGDEVRRLMSGTSYADLIFKEGFSPQLISDADLAKMVDFKARFPDQGGTVEIFDDLIAGVRAGAPTATAQIADTVTDVVGEGAEIAVASPSTDAAAAKVATGFFGKLKAYFSETKSAFGTFFANMFAAGGSVTALAPPTTGRGTAGVFNLVFGSPAKVIAGLVIISGLLSHLPDLIRGWSDEFSQVADIFRNMFETISEVVAHLFGYGDDVRDTSAAFEAIGDVIGKVVLKIAEFIEMITEVIGTIFRFVADVGNVAFVALSKLIGALWDLIHLDIVGFFENLMDAVFGFGSQASVLNRILGATVALFITIVSLNKLITIWGAMAFGVSVLAKALFTATAAGAGFFTAMTVGWAEMRAAVALTSPMLAAFLNPWILIPTLVVAGGLVIQSFFDDVNEAAEEAAKHVESLMTAINDLNEAIKETPDSVDFSGYLNELETAITAITEANQGGDEFFGTHSKIFEDALAWRPSGLNQDWEGQLRAAAMYTGNLKELRETQKEINTLNKINLKNIEGLDEVKLDNFKKQLNDRIRELKVLAQTYYSLGDSEKYFETAQTIASLQNVKSQIQTVGLDTQAYWGTALERVNSLLVQANANMNNIGNQDLPPEFFDELESQLSTLTSRVEDSFFSAFDAQADARINAFDKSSQARIDAMDERAQNALDDFDEAEQDRLDAFDKRSEHRLELFDKDAEGQIAAIDKKIDAIQKENDKEAWLQQQQEWRQQRAQILREQELSDAMNFRERMKAIHEGRYDDARILELQSLQDQEETNRQLRELRQEEKDAREQRREDKRTNELEKQKERLQKQLDNQREQLQKQLDNQREKLQEKLDNQRQHLQDQLDAQKNALQEQIDQQKQALQEQIDQQRQFLQNMMEEFDEFTPKNKKQWRDHFEDIKDTFARFGIDVGDGLDAFYRDWHMGLNKALNDTYRDAYGIAVLGGDQVASAAQQTIDKGVKPASQADIHLYEVMVKYIEAVQDAKGGMDPGTLSQWIQRISNAMDRASSRAAEAVGDYVPIDITPHHVQGAAHTGGLINKKDHLVNSKNEVVARLLPGEFVMQPDAVKHYGASLMSDINEKKAKVSAFELEKYHEGGFVFNQLGASLKGQVLQKEAPVGMIQPAYAQLLGQVGRGIVHAIGAQLGSVTLGSARKALADKLAAMRRTGGGGGPTGTVPVEGYGDTVGVGPNATYWPATSSNDWYGSRTDVGAEYMRNLFYQSRAWARGTFAVQNFIAKARATFPSYHDIYFGPYDYARRGYNGASGPPWSQHSWGNALDFNTPSEIQNNQIANWIQKNAGVLNLRTLLWKDPNHFGHIHVDFHPATSDMASPPFPRGHKGGIFTGRGFNNRFEAPALLQPGEMVLPKNVSKALAGGIAPAGDMTIEVNIEGDFYGDERSYRKLYETMERVGNKIARERGVKYNTVVKAGEF